MSKSMSTPRRAARRLLVQRVLGAGAVAALGLPGRLAAAPAAGPLARPASPVLRPERSVLLGLTRAGQRLVAVGERGLVLLSDDEGRSWRQAVQVPVSATLTAVQFVDARSGWAVGHYGVVLHSDDGGERWTRRLDGVAAAALVLGAAERRVKQEPGAAADAALADAQRLVQEGADKPFFTLRFDDARRGWVAGAYGLMLATEDGGASWASIGDRLDNPRASHLYAIDKRGEQMLVAGEQGLLLHSADGGRRFRRVATPYAGSWFTAATLIDGSWLVAGLRGNALRSADEGRRWSRLDSPAPVGITALARDAHGAPWLANQAGQVWSVDTAAGALRLHAASPAMQPGALLPLADGGWLLAGWNGVTRADAARR
jgi:photosystem II stability/assembly factor-like uncharacterized protein